MQAANNVVMFPSKNNNDRPSAPQSIQEIRDNMDMIKHVHIHETIQAIAPKIFEQLAIAGYDLTDEGMEDDLKIGAFFVESMRSMLCKYYRIHHPFQDIAENIFIDDGDGGLTIEGLPSILVSDNEGNS
jgi:hypothetical protein